MPTGQGPYDYYLGLLSQWPTSIALVSQWLVAIYFDDVNPLLANISNSLKGREQKSEWSYNGEVINLLTDGSLQNNVSQMMGCVFSRQVTLPSETIDVANQGLEYGGFLPPATANTRGKYEPLSIQMLETNASFLDFVIRPWTIMVGYNGLVARAPGSPKNVKAAAIDVVMYGKIGAGVPLGIRKIYRFKNCAPINIGSETYSYTEEGLRTNDVKFAYDTYGVLDGNSGDFIYLP